MTPDQGEIFLQALGVHNAKLRNGVWLTGSCPLAKWMHQSQKDSSPSFAIKVEPGEESMFHCFGCKSGKLLDLVQRLEFYAHVDGTTKQYAFTQARQVLENETVEVLPLPEYSEFGRPGQEFQEWPEWFIDSFLDVTLSAHGMGYLKSRGVSPEQALLRGLRYDTNRRMVVFPFHNVYGKLAGARGRSIVSGTKNPHYDYTWNKVNNTRLVWYNEPVLQQLEPVAVVEGQFDCLRVARVYPIVVANLTAKATQEKLRKLGQAPMVILFPDNDLAGEQSTEKYVRFCREMNIPLAIVSLEDAPKDPAFRKSADDVIAKDPGEADLDWIEGQLQIVKNMSS